MNKITIKKFNNKYNIFIFNVQKLSGNYKMSFEIRKNIGEKYDICIIVRRNETITQAIERVLNK